MDVALQLAERELPLPYSSRSLTAALPGRGVAQEPSAWLGPLSGLPGAAPHAHSPGALLFLSLDLGQHHGEIEDPPAWLVNVLLDRARFAARLGARAPPRTGRASPPSRRRRSPSSTCPCGPGQRRGARLCAAPQVARLEKPPQGPERLGPLTCIIAPTPNTQWRHRNGPLGSGAAALAGAPRTQPAHGSSGPVIIAGATSRPSAPRSGKGMRDSDGAERPRPSARRPRPPRRQRSAHRRKLHPASSSRRTAPTSRLWAGFSTASRPP